LHQLLDLQRLSAVCDLAVQAAAFRPPSDLPLENLGVVPAEVLAARVALFVDWQPHRLAVKVLEQIAGRAPRQGPRDPYP